MSKDPANKSDVSDDDLGVGSLLTVLDIQRYIADPAFVQQTQLNVDSIFDAYDITVSNTRKKYKHKLVLAPKFNSLVQKRKLRVGSRIRLVAVKRCQDTANPCAVVEDLIVQQQGSADLNVLLRLPWNENEGHQLSQPLTTFRGYYVDVWCDADVAASSDTFQVLRAGSLDISGSDLYSLQEVIHRFHSIKSAKPRLLLRVMRRAKLFHYARPGVKEKWPFQMQLTVGDETGCCIAVFWNAMAVRYVHHLQEGDIILLRNFTVKPKFQMPDHLAWQHPDLPWFDIDININHNHPQAEVTIVEPAAAESLQDVSLPLPPTLFITRRQLSSLPDGFQCDVAGLVTFVGAVQREKMKNKPNCDRFWIKRWIQMKDGSSDHLFVINLYRGVQKKEFEELAVGLFLVCRNMRVVRRLDQGLTSKACHYVYLTSTRDTQIYLSKDDEDNYPFANEATLQSAKQYAASHVPENEDNDELLSMLFTFPPQPTSFQSFLSGRESLKVCPTEEWAKFDEDLRYRVVTQLTIQAKLVRVSFHQGLSTLRKSKRLHKQLSQEHAAGRSSNKTSPASIGIDPNSSDSVIDAEKSTYFLFSWKGLNTDVILNSVKQVRLQTCPQNLTLPMFLSGEFEARPGAPIVPVSDAVTAQLVSWDTSSVDLFLVALDVFCVDGEHAIFGVNRAFPVL